MRSRQILLGLVSAGLVCGVLCGQSPQTKRPSSATAPTTRPAEQVLGPVNDQWLADICRDELRRAASNGTCAALARTVKAAMLARLACGPASDLATLRTMTYVLKACQYLPLAEEVSGGKKFGTWLLDQEELSRRLFRALEDVRSPEASLEQLWELAGADEKAVVSHPDLAVAFATSLPLRHYRPQPEPCSMLQSFAWYTKADVAFRYDLKKMPYELSRYLADTRLNLAERAWAASRYRNVSNPARTYFDVKYDYDFYRKGTDKKIARLPYTLQNLRRVGGVCIEQAYFASEACKALGIPATIVAGRGESGIGHAWLACLKLSRDGREAYWDSRTGRYDEQRYFTGELWEPANREKILDSELMLVGAAAQLPLTRREEAYTAVVLAGLADQARDQSPDADVSVLAKLAEAYNQQIASKGNRPPARVDWIGAHRKIDLAVVEELLSTAIARNLAHKPAWEFIVELRKADRMPVADLDRFFDVLVTRTAKTYPDYSCVLVMRIVPTLADAAQREKVYQRATGVYGNRPDLYSWILIALGDDYAEQGKKAHALRAYEQAALRCVDFAAVVLVASERAERLLLDAKRRDLAIQMYKKLFGRAKRPKSAFRAQTAHYQLGKRLAVLLREAGQERAADRIEDSL